MNDLLPAKDKFIQAAADLSGRDPGQLDAQEAIHILQEYGGEPQGDLYRQLTDDAARELFSDPEAAQEWQKITGELWDGEMPDLLALALQRDLTPLIMEKAKALRDDLPQDDPKRQQAEQILNAPLLSQEAQEKLEYTREIIEIVREAIRPAVEGARQVAQQIQEVVNATAEPRRVLGEVFKQWNDLREAMAQFMENNPAFLLYSEATGELAPYIEAELKKPEYGGKTLEDIWNEAGEQYDDGILDDNSPLMQLVNAARAARDAEQADKEEPAPATALPSVKYTPADNQQIQLNIDKLMRQIFNPRTADKAASGAVDLYIRDPAAGDYKPKRGEIPGQLSFFPVSYEKAGKEEITLYYALDYDGDVLKKLGLTGETTAEDFFILSVIADAAVTGNTNVSPAKLYREFTGKAPNTDQRTQFVNRLMKMAGTMVDLDDREVMQAWGQETYNQYYGQLAPLKFINKRHVVNGGIVDGIIKITDFPDVLRTGRQIGQYITIPKTLLYVKKNNGRAVKRTPRFYELLMILLKEIAMIKNGSRQNKILYSWLYKEMDIAEKDYHGREDTLETLYVILDHFKREKWITGYKEETTKSTGEVGVKFYWRDADGKTIADKKGTRKRTTKPRKPAAK